MIKLPKYIRALQSSTNATLTLTLLIASWIVYIQQGWVTEDSVLYYEMARLISLGEWKSAYAMFQWPLYPALIACIHNITGLGFQYSGHFLSVTFFTLTTWAITKIVAQLGGSLRAQILAVFILMGSRYIVGDIMPMSTRDQGYWAIMCLAIWQLIAFYQHRHIKAAFAWQIFAILAILFRIEGTLLLMALPLVALSLNDVSLKQKLNLLLQTYSLFIIGGLCLIVGAFVLGLFDLAHLGRAKELLTGFSDIERNITENLFHRVEIMRDEVIGEPFKEFAWFTFLLSLFSISVIKCCFVAGWAPPILTLFGYKKIKSHLEPVALKILIAAGLVIWLTGCLIIFKVNILSGRYVALFGLVLVIISAVILDVFIKNWTTSNRKQQVLITVCLLIVVSGIIGNIWPKQHGYSHERDASLYVKYALKSGEKALFTTPRQRFYADAPYEGQAYDDWQFITERIEDGRINNYQYLVIHLDIKPDTPQKENYLAKHLPTFKLDKTFYGYKKKKRILVYKHIAD